MRRILSENARTYLAGTLTGLAFIIGIQVIGRILIAVFY